MAFMSIRKRSFAMLAKDADSIPNVKCSFTKRVRHSNDVLLNPSRPLYHKDRAFAFARSAKHLIALTLCDHAFVLMQGVVIASVFGYSTVQGGESTGQGGKSTGQGDEFTHVWWNGRGLAVSGGRNSQAAIIAFGCEPTQSHSVTVGSQAEVPRSHLVTVGSEAVPAVRTHRRQLHVSDIRQSRFALHGRGVSSVCCRRRTIFAISSGLQESCWTGRGMTCRLLVAIVGIRWARWALACSVMECDQLAALRQIPPEVLKEGTPGDFHLPPTSPYDVWGSDHTYESLTIPCEDGILHSPGSEIGEGASSNVAVQVMVTATP
eukprot:1194310-Prorocentrum_minimum.AAC.2